MDRWLAAVEADQSADPLEVKIVRDKPADILIACWISGVMVTDQSRCDTTFPYFREPRTVAGENPTIYTMKCQLKPLNRNDYNVTFTDAQWARLAGRVPDGRLRFRAAGYRLSTERSVAYLRRRPRRCCRLVIRPCRMPASHEAGASCRAVPAP